MAELVVVTGPPGAGKTTVARKLAHSFERSVLVQGDHFFGFLAAGSILPWLPNTEHQNGVVWRAASAATGRFVKGGYDTIYEGVLPPGRLPEFIAECKVDALHYAILLPSPECCTERVATRPGHGFTDAAVTLDVHRGFAEADVDRRHVLLNPPEEIDDVVRLIQQRISDGSLLYRQPV